ncbi:hypothetical protein [Pseudoalteromonas sp. MMG007]|uniref:hypothetical protein n=1 Tax=Pseudoalteromonas sp. MMG007 TaxID=2822684 RepID=UPI001B3699C5|nr:hypothetical protein [Pseudoalteromonas sp. MMG007]MBQ4859247.1 hypothetical protein [Pseudoalteromonas sp. MMG007]
MSLLSLNVLAKELLYKKADLDNFIEFATGDDVGYLGEKIDNQTWRVKYVGMDNTSFDELNALILKRISELCTNGFAVMDSMENASIVAHRKPVKKGILR